MSNVKPYGTAYQNAVRDLMARIDLKKSRRAVMNALLQHCNGQSGQTRPGRKRIMDLTGLKDRALDDCLKDLRERKLIVPMAYLEGGRGRATVYRFSLPAWSGTKVETPAANAVVKGGSQEPKPPHFVQQTPAANAVPTNRTDIKGKAAGRGQVGRDAPLKGEAQEQERSDLLQFSQDVTRYGYGEARRLQQERKIAGMAAE